MSEDTKSKQGKAGAQSNPFNLPDFSELLNQWQLPGIDFGALMQDGQKNIEALQQANQLVAEGWQKFGQKQQEMFQQGMQRIQERASQAGSGAATTNMDQQMQQAREDFEQAIADMRQLAEITLESQSKAFDVIRQRFEDAAQSATGKNKT